MESVAVRLPVIVGLKVTVIVHFAPAARELPQVLVWAKSPGLAPLRPIALMLSDVVKLLVTVTFFAALVVPTFTVPNDQDEGSTVTGSLPMPVRLMVCGLLMALSVIVTVPDSFPGLVGAKVTVILQVP